jgi:hypothetical protein
MVGYLSRRDLLIESSWVVEGVPSGVSLGEGLFFERHVGVQVDACGGLGFVCIGWAARRGRSRAIRRWR